VKRSAEEKWEILQERLKGGNIAETCSKDGVAPNLSYHRRDEVDQGAPAALGEKRGGRRGRRAVQTPETTGPSAGRQAVGDRNPKNRVGE